MARLTREEQQLRNREDLLDAAERLFADRGVSGTSLDDVAREAGLTKGAVYSNFANKGDLILQVLQRQASRPDVVAAPADADARAALQARCDSWVTAAEFGLEAARTRLVFDFVPFALGDPELGRRYAELVTDAESPQAPLPPESPLSGLSAADQHKLLAALDLGLSLLRQLDPDAVDPELYRAGVNAFAGPEAPAPADEEAAPAASEKKRPRLLRGLTRA